MGTWTRKITKVLSRQHASNDVIAKFNIATAGSVYQVQDYSELPNFREILYKDAKSDINDSWM